MPNDVSGFLFDLDGVFYVENTLIPGALQVLDRLDESGIPYAFITNTTTKSVASLCHKLSRLGMNVVPEQLISAPVATRDYLLGEGIERCYFAVGEDVLEDFGGIDHSENDPQAVVIGDIGDNWNYRLLDTLFQKLIGGAQLVATHRNKYWQKAGGLHVDIGAFVAGLEYAADVKAVITGKPSQAFFNTALNVLELEKSQVVLVGDDVQSDIGGAQQAGIRGALVKTGKYRQELVAKSGITPDWLVNSIADIPATFGL